MADEVLGVFAFSHVGLNVPAYTVVIAPNKEMARQVLSELLSHEGYDISEHHIALEGALDADKPGVIVVSDGEH